MVFIQFILNKMVYDHNGRVANVTLNVNNREK